MQFAREMEDEVRGVDRGICEGAWMPGSGVKWAGDRRAKAVLGDMSWRE